MMNFEIDLHKKQLRKNIFDLKRCLSDEDKEKKSFEIINKIEMLSEFINSDNILLYSSLADEVFTVDALLRWFGRKKIYLPVVEGDILKIREYNPSKMRIGKYGISEPVGEDLENLNIIDLMIVPGVAFDKNCNRLGRGKGYYDKLLIDISALKIGICYQCQIAEIVPTDNFDIPMDYVISESVTYKRF